MTVTAALSGPLSWGVKVTVMVQFAPAARVVAQVLVWEKLVTLDPVMEIRLMVTVAVPTFVSVRFCGALDVFNFWVPKFRLDGVMLITVPVPMRIRVCGLFPASSVMVTAPLCVPDPVG